MSGIPTNSNIDYFAHRNQRCRIALCAAVMAMGVVIGFGSGCGTTKVNSATEQMLGSDAVDAAVSKLDFTSMAGRKVFFDTRYMMTYKPPTVVNTDYVISSLRQQMSAAGLLLQESEANSELVLEGRLGVLGSDIHDLTYGIPANSLLSNAAQIAASATPGVPTPPAIPEMSVARRSDQSAATKIGIFAYDRVSREVVWQSGSSVARSTAKDLWVFGIGPFQKGSIYQGRVKIPGENQGSRIRGTREGVNGPIVAYTEERIFKELPPIIDPNAGDEDKGVMMASGEEVVGEAGAQVEKKAKSPPPKQDYQTEAPMPVDGHRLYPQVDSKDAGFKTRMAPYNPLRRLGSR